LLFWSSLENFLNNYVVIAKVVDFEENVVVDMPSKKLKVNPNNEFIQLLKDNKLDYKLN
jgi:hypothetical protein